jgi:hypothetical protein
LCANNPKFGNLSKVKIPEFDDVKKKDILSMQISDLKENFEILSLNFEHCLFSLKLELHRKIYKNLNISVNMKILFNEINSF